MPVEETLRRIEGDLAAGNPRKALERLRGLLSTFPHRIDLRLRMADAYSALGDRAQAGRWRYLRRPRTLQEAEERRAFEAWAGGWPNRANRLLHLIRWPGPIDEVADEEARKILLELRDAARRRGRWVEFDESGRRVPHQRWWLTLLEAGAVIFALTLFVGILVGVVLGIGFLLESLSRLL
ncbi:MAG TPA: DUF6584 family protein [Acidimicrobiales bacterium]|nr:DUF6584 family protein [Acidimicrobiales bacterium]